MIVLNFSHPHTAARRGHVEALAGRKGERVIEARAQFDHQQPFAPQVRTLVFEGVSRAWSSRSSRLGLTGKDWVAAWYNGRSVWQSSALRGGRLGVCHGRRVCLGRNEDDE